MTRALRLFVATACVALAFPGAAPCGSNAPDGFHAAPSLHVGAGVDPEWRLSLTGRLSAPPVASGGVIWAACEDRTLAAVTPAGKLLWKLDLATADGALAGASVRSGTAGSPDGSATPVSPVGEPVVLPGGPAIFKTASGAIVAVGPTGSPLWTARPFPPGDQSRSPHFPPVAGWDGRLFCVSGSAGACLGTTGLVKWRLSLGRAVSARPVAAPGGAFAVATEDGTVRLVGPFGAVLASGDAGAPVLSLAATELPPAAAEGTDILAAGTRDGRVLIFRVPSGSSPDGGGAGAGARLSVAGTFTVGGQVVALRQEGHLLWGATASPGAVFAINPGEGRGKPRWSARIGLPDGDVALAPLAGGGMAVLSRAGAWGYGPDGRRAFLLGIQGAAMRSSLDEGGTLVLSGGEDWILYAYGTGLPRVDGGEKSGNQAGTYGLAAYRPLSATALVDPDDLAEKLAEIADRVHTGMEGNAEKEDVARLSAIAAASVDRHDGRLDPRARVPVQVRARACTILGELGSTETTGLLARVFRADPDASVQASAAFALGIIGADPEQAAIGAFYEAIRFPVPLPEGVVAYETARAIGRICRYSGRDPDGRGVEMLVRISGSPYPALIRDAARGALDSLMVH